ncbi:GNAT family N-acetyltransferase [Massilia terrae]|uniref:GNAT family N-acetyltransferase n=1 Tax=Massilia terrae TaxID=1811224 RepID=A0ABT2CWH0_9BURK|nr:GNAT family N-acetyltransferase [Massilia terrae]MCS0658321.1 GNAT family N-acetyltransferase [Massilia terrae]
MNIVETARLRLRTITLDDADVEFHLALLNDPAFIENIGDRGVRTLDDSRRYIADGPVAMQGRYGHSMYVVELKDSGVPIGMCGLIKRETLVDVDIGYAFLPEYRGAGYAYEAARATVEHARELGIERLAGITSPDNVASNALLQKLGLRFKCVMHLTPDDTGTNFYIALLNNSSSAAA